MYKKRIIMLALAALLVLAAGCSQGAADAQATPTPEINPTIIEYKDTVITKDEVTMKMNRYLSAEDMAITDLSEGEDQELWGRFKDDIVQELAVNEMALEKAVELGLDKLTEEEEATLDDSYESSLASIKQIVDASVKADMTSDETLVYDTEYERQLKEYFFGQGYNIDTYREDLEKEYIISKVKDDLTKDETITEQEVRDYYDSNVQVQKNNIELSADTVEQQIAFGGNVLYYPEGYMMIRHILIGYDSETRGSAAVAYSDGDFVKYNKIIDEALVTIQPKLDEIIARLEAGEDFGKLFDEYNEDEAANEEPFKTDGFVVGPYTSIELPGYLDAVLTLKEAGQYSEPVNTFYGCYIIHCEKMLAGAVPFEDVKDTYTESLLKNKKDMAWSTATQVWVDDALAAGTLKLYTEKY